MQTLKIFSDGGSRGNPGPAGIGVLIEIRPASPSQDGNLETQIRIEKISEYIGEGTNNFAEYTAVIHALRWCKVNVKDDVSIEFYLDSQLVVEQLNQRYKLKNKGLKPLFWKIRELILELGGKVNFKYIPREQNQEADTLVNMALDQQLKGNK